MHVYAQYLVVAGITISLGSKGAGAAPFDNPACHYLPGDHDWPSRDKWNQLNESVGGRLILGKPLAQICHGSTYDPIACSELQREWTQPPI